MKLIKELALYLYIHLKVDTCDVTRWNNVQLSHMRTTILSTSVFSSPRLTHICATCAEDQPHIGNDTNMRPRRARSLNAYRWERQR